MLKGTSKSPTSNGKHGGAMKAMLMTAVNQPFS